MSRRVTAAIAALLAVSALGFASAALAGDGGGDDDVRVSGRCTGSATSELELSPEDGRIEVEFEVDQNRAGVRWQVVLRRQGTVFFRGSRVTRGPSGSFELRAGHGQWPRDRRHQGPSDEPERPGLQGDGTLLGQDSPGSSLAFAHKDVQIYGPYVCLQDLTPSLWASSSAAPRSRASEHPLRRAA